MALRGPVICTRRLKGEGLEGQGAVQPRLILAPQKALRIACRTSCQFGDDSFDTRSMISETVEKSAGLKKTGCPAFGPTGSIRKVSVSPSLKAGHMQFEDGFHSGSSLAASRPF